MEPKPYHLRLGPTSITSFHQCFGAALPGAEFSSHVDMVRKVFRCAGFGSEIFCSDEARSGKYIPEGTLGIDRLEAFAAGSILVYHLLPGCNVARNLVMRTEPLVVWHYGGGSSLSWRAWDRERADELHALELRLRVLAPRAALGIGASPSALREVIGANYARTGMATALVDPRRPVGEEDAPDPGGPMGEVKTRDPSAGSRWLAAGPLEPDQRIETVLSAFAVYQRVYDFGATLRIVSRDSYPPYERALRAFVGRLDLEGAVEIFTSSDVSPHVSAGADVVVTAALRATTGWTVVKAMFSGTPVVSTTDSPHLHLCGPGNVVACHVDPVTMAAAVHRVLTEIPYRDRIVHSAIQRAQQLIPAAGGSRLLEVLQQVAGTLGQVA